MNQVQKAKFSMLPDSAAVLRDELRWKSPKPIDVYWEEDGSDGAKGVYTTDEGDMLFHLKARKSDGGETYHRFYTMPAASIEGGAVIAQAFMTRLGTEEEPEPTVSAQGAEPAAKAEDAPPEEGEGKSVFKGLFTAGRELLDGDKVESGQEEPK